MKKNLIAMLLFFACAACNNDDAAPATMETGGTGTTTGTDTSATPDSVYTNPGINSGSSALTSTDTGNQRRNQ